MVLKMAVIAQLVARRSNNPKVVSSILTHRIFAERLWAYSPALHVLSRSYTFSVPSSSIQIRGSTVIHISACHTEDQGSVPGRGVMRLFTRLGRLDWLLPSARAPGPNYFNASQHDAGVSPRGVWRNGSASESRLGAGSLNLSGTSKIFEK